MNGELPQQPTLQDVPTSLSPQQPAYPDRRGWLIAFGVFECLLGLAMFAMTALMAFAFISPPPQARQDPNLTPVLMAAIVAIYAGIGVIWIVLGVGSILAKNWARIASIVLSSLWLGLGVLTFLVMVVVMPAAMDAAVQQQKNPQNLPAGFGTFMKVFMFVFMAAFMVLLPAILLFFYTRKGVRATCRMRSPVTAGSTDQKPVAIWILLAIYGIGALSSTYVFFSSFFSGLGSVFFGIVISGAAHKVILGANFLIHVFLLVKIYRMERIGWVVAMGWQLFWFASMCVTFLVRRDLIQLYREMGMKEEQLQAFMTMPAMLPVILVGTLVMVAAMTGFIAYTGKYFKSSASPVAGTSLP